MHTRIRSTFIAAFAVFAVLLAGSAPANAQNFVGDCVGRCGNTSVAGNCWCDDACFTYNDCCTTYIAACKQPEILDVSPDVLPYGGGALRIAGSNFEGFSSTLSSVKVGGVACSTVAWSPNEIRCTAAPGNQLNREVVVTTQYGTVKGVFVDYVYADECATKADGASCVSASPCLGGGTCQNRVCIGTAPRNVGKACDDLNPCTGNGTCSSSGSCAGAPAANTGGICDDGNACTRIDRCSSGSCAGSAYSCNDNNAATTDLCRGDGTCTHVPLVQRYCDDNDPCTHSDACEEPGVPESGCTGTAYVCDDGSPYTGDACDGFGGCIVTKQVQGGVCERASDCATGHCVDGVCCNADCSGASCAACNVAGHVGTCTPVTGAPVPGHPACGSDGGSCGGFCDGASASCTYPGAATTCLAAACVGGDFVGSASCGGSGACTSAPAPVDCGLFACTASGCRTSCTSLADCVGADVCTAGACRLDTVAPFVTVPGLLVREATSPAGAAVTFTTSALDAVSGPRAVTCTPASGTTFALGNTSVTCSASDAKGNVGTAGFTVRVVDTTPPALAGVPPAPLVVEATGPLGAAVSWNFVTASDAVSGAVVASCSPASGATFALGTTTVACGAQDAAGNVTSASFLVRVVDTTAPVFANVPAALVLEATGPAGAVAAFHPTATDLVAGAIFVYCAPPSGALFPLGETTVTCTAWDPSGNLATARFPVTVLDRTPPVVVGAPAAPVVVEATSPAGASATWAPLSGLDVVSGPVAVACAPAAGSTFALGLTNVTCSSSDGAGNAASASFAVVVRDTTAPSFANVPASPIVLEATGPNGAPALFAPTAGDLVSGAVVVTCAPASGATFGLGETVVTCAAADGAGNTSSVSFTVLVRDTTPVAFSNVAASLVAEATGPSGARVTWPAVEAVDLVSGTVAVSCVPSSGFVFALGTTTVTCAAADAAGNASSTSFTVTVRDTTAPTFAHLGDLSLEATGPAGATATFAPSATDLVSGGAAVRCDHLSGALFPLGLTTVTCSAEDAAGNAGTTSFLVRVADTTAPMLELPALVTLEASGPAGADTRYAFTADDLVSGTLAVTCAPASGALLPLGPTVVSCSTTDAAGNTASGSFVVAVVDTTAPALVAPASRTLEATGPGGVVAAFAGSALDTVDGFVAVACDPASGALFGLGTTVVGCTATDAAGNTSNDAFEVTVVDTTAPTVRALAEVTREATGPQGANITFAVVADDLVSGALEADCTPVSGSFFGIGTTQVTCAATDAAGNTAGATFAVTVLDSTPPELTLPGDLQLLATTVPCGAGSAAGASGVGLPCPPGQMNVAGALASWTASALDVTDGPRPVSCTPGSGTFFAPGTTTVTCSATDTRGNTATGTFRITVAYEWSGFKPPVRAGDRFNLGRVVPLKFELTSGSAGATLTQTRAYAAKVTNGVVGAPAPARGANGETANLFRTTGGQYHFNWDTSGLTTGTWQILVDLGDGLLRPTTVELR